MEITAVMKDVLTITPLCIDCGMCRETCPFQAVVCAFEKRHRYEILPHSCEWCGGPGKAPCEIYCPVRGAIVAAKWEEPQTPAVVG
ncbi:MAG: 4Fe-4S dicluster domain [Candidatus Binatota bacterium]|jgi:MinD superfamily P-loop ATPase|nr:4Fe-4S dicluster domain [Candidatus Binatota bacterium]